MHSVFSFFSTEKCSSTFTSSFAAVERLTTHLVISVAKRIVHDQSRLLAKCSVSRRIVIIYLFSSRVFSFTKYDERIVRGYHKHAKEFLSRPQSFSCHVCRVLPFDQPDQHHPYVCIIPAAIFTYVHQTYFTSCSEKV